MEHLKLAYKGLIDSFRGFYTLFVLDRNYNERQAERLSASKHSNSPVRLKQSKQYETTRANVPSKQKGEIPILKKFSCCAILNGAVFLLSVLIWDYVVMPLVRWITFFIAEKICMGSGESPWYWIGLGLTILFRTFWVVPLFGLTKVLNNLWCQDISQLAYRRVTSRSSVSLGLSKTLADFVFSTVVETLFLLQALLVSYIPVCFIGKLLSVVHLSLLYSLYAFEYRWSEMGYGIHKRLFFIEKDYTYYIAFGLPLALCSQVTERYIINGCIFSILFPIFIVGANEAEMPSDSNRMHIPIFSLVITISNLIFDLVIRHSNRTQQPPVPTRR